MLSQESEQLDVFAKGSPTFLARGEMSAHHPHLILRQFIHQEGMQVVSDRFADQIVVFHVV
ncbi:MAG: hypothetical protein M3R13_09690 [Armatimonadota bacterium]|nr:hypothetical protein [Armatimonadota bacterium]